MFITIRSMPSNSGHLRYERKVPLILLLSNRFHLLIPENPTGCSCQGYYNQGYYYNMDLQV